MFERKMGREEFEKRIAFFNDYCELLLKSFSSKRFGFKIVEKRLEKDPKSFGEHFVLNVTKEFPESDVEEIFDIRNRIEDGLPGCNSDFVRITTFLISRRYSPANDFCEEYIIYIGAYYSRPHELKTSVKLHERIESARVIFKVLSNGSLVDSSYYNDFSGTFNMPDPDLAILSRNIDELKECFKQEKNGRRII